MPEVESITRVGPLAVPYAYQLGVTETLRPISIFAHVDGTGASGAFLICVTYKDQNGNRFSRAFNATSVAAGASADVSWFPGGDLGATAASGGGIQFNTNPQGGTYLDVQTTGNDGVVASGINFAPTDGFRVTGTDGQTGPTVFVSQTTAHANVGFTTAQIINDDGGLNANSPTVLQLSASKTGTGAGGAVGLDTNGDIEGGSGDAVGILASATNNSGGREIAVSCQTQGNRVGANSLALLCLSSAAANIFQVRNDGSVHIKAGTAVIADL